MADNIETQEQGAATTTVTPSVSPEVAEMMAISLNGGITPAKTEETNTEQAASAAAQTTVLTEEKHPDFTFDSLKGKFGYEKPEDVFKEIEELRVLKANPTPAEIKYENEKSQKLAQAFQAGKFDEVFNYLNEERQLEKLTTTEVNKDTAADIIKLSMNLKYREEGLTEAEINHKYNKQYALPKEPKIGDTEDPDLFDERMTTWKEQCSDIEMNKIIDAKVAKRELEQAKSKLILPEIGSNVDGNYVQYLKDLDDTDKSANEATEDYKKFTPKALETKINFNDEANKIAFEFQYEPDVDSFNQAVAIVSNGENLSKAFANKDGTPNRQKFLDALYFGLNKDKVLSEAMKQAKNATIKAMMPDNSGNGMNRQQPQNQEQSELDKNMKRSLQGFI